MAMKTCSNFLLFFFLIITGFQLNARDTNDFLAKTAKYLPAASDSIKFDRLYYEYNLNLANKGFQLNFTINVATQQTDCFQQNPNISNFCDYQRVLLTFGLIEAKQLGSALSAYQYSENYKREIFKISDSVFRAYDQLRSLCRKETGEGMLSTGIERWEQICLQLLQKNASPVSPLSLQQKVVGTGLLLNAPKYANPKKFLFFASRSTVFEDNFMDNRSGWHADVSDSLMSRYAIPAINKGNFSITNLSAERLCYAIDPTVDFSRDFEIHLDFEIRSSKKKSDYAIAFFWGLDTSLADKGSTWIGISRLGDYSLTFCHGGDHTNDEHNHFFKPLSPGTVHLTIRKLNNQYYFFVNGDYKRSYPFHTLSGNEWALCAEEGSEVVYHKLKVDYLN